MTQPNGSQIAILHRVSKIVSSGANLDEMLQELVDLTVRVTACDACLVYLVCHSSGEIVLRASQLPHDREIGQVRLKMGEGVTGWVALYKSLVALAENAAADSRFKSFPALPEDTYEAFLSVPLVSGGDVIGVINVHHREKHVHDADERALLSFLGEQMGGAIVKSRLAEHTKSAVKRMEALAAITRAISAENYLDGILRSISEMVAESLDSPACNIMLVDEERQELVTRAGRSSSPGYLQSTPLKIEDSAIGRVVQERRPMVIDSEFDYSPGLRSLLSVPLFLHNSVLGVINIYTGDRRVFTDEEFDFVKVVAGQAATAIDNSRLLSVTLELKRTLETRKVIERAKSILQSKFGMTEEAAYLRLRDESRRRRRPMRDLAEAVIIADELNDAKL
jgi:signal transduction protein with GAF and PtsI domain